MNVELLKNYIKNSPLSTEELGLVINISKSTIYFQLKNNMIDSKNLTKIFDVLNLSNDQILSLFNR